MLNRRYGEPYRYINNAIKRKKLDETVRIILEQEEEDRCFALYLSSVANPFAEQMTFDDFLQKATGRRKGAAKQSTKTPAELVADAEKVLAGFTPPQREGV